jgi:hypothetical protein
MISKKKRLILRCVITYLSLALILEWEDITAFGVSHAVADIIETIVGGFIGAVLFYYAFRFVSKHFSSPKLN